MSTTCQSGLTDTEKNRIFWASFFALLACSVGFTFRVMTMDRWGMEFGLDNQQVGQIFGASLWPIAITMIIFSLLVDKIGYKLSIYIAFALQALSIILTVSADSADALWWGACCAGLGHGVIEAVINPVCASIYTKNKSTKLNILHAAWPAGMVLGSLLILPLGIAESSLGLGVVEGASGLAWRTHAWWMLIPVVIYGLMFLKCKFPVDERVRAKVPYRDMLKQVGFLGAIVVGTLLFYEIYRLASGSEPADLLWMSLGFGTVLAAAFGAYTKSIGKPLFFMLCLLMIPLAITELGTDAWIKKLMTPQMGDYAGWAIAFSAFIMMALRFFAGSLLRRISPPTVLTISAIFSMMGLLILSEVSGYIVFLAFVLYAIGQTFYWPTVLGLVAERFPKGGALTLNTVSAIGMLSVGIVGTPILGAFYDSQLSAQVQQISPAIYQDAQKEKNFFSTTYIGIDEGKAKQAAQDAGLSKEFAAATDESGRGALKTTALTFPLIMFICFGLISLYFRSKGGYKPVLLEDGGDNIHQDPEGEAIAGVEL